MSDEIMARLRKLEAGEIARGAINKYCLAVDTDDLQLLRSCFTDDARMAGHYMGELKGLEKIGAYFDEVLSTPVKHRKHYVMNSSITGFEDDVVTATSYFLSYNGETNDLNIAWGRYDWKTRVSGDGGAICDLVVTLDQLLANISEFAPSK